jgi:hypothetical protein
MSNHVPSFKLNRMDSNKLDKDYLEFINSRGDWREIIQDTIDRMQYHPGFLDRLIELNKEYDSPFEVGNQGGIRIIKLEYLKTAS